MFLFSFEVRERKASTGVGESESKMLTLIGEVKYTFKQVTRDEFECLTRMM